MTAVRLIAAAVLVLLSMTPAFAQLSPLRYGTWISTSPNREYDPGPPPMSQNRTEELVGGAMKTSVEGVDARGNRIAYEFAVPADGKDHPVTGVGMPYGSDTIAMIVLDSVHARRNVQEGRHGDGHRARGDVEGRPHVNRHLEESGERPDHQ